MPCNQPVASCISTTIPAFFRTIHRREPEKSGAGGAQPQGRRLQNAAAAKPRPRAPHGATVLLKREDLRGCAPNKIRGAYRKMSPRPAKAGGRETRCASAGPAPWAWPTPASRYAASFCPPKRARILPRRGHVRPPALQVGFCNLFFIKPLINKCLQKSRRALEIVSCPKISFRPLAAAVYLRATV